MELKRPGTRAMLAGIAVIGLLAGAAIVTMHYLNRPYRPGTSVEQTLSCSWPECKIEIYGDDATKPRYLWTTDYRVGGGVSDLCHTVSRPIPETWWNSQVTGELLIHRDWSTSPRPAATFTSGDDTIDLFGGDTSYAKFLYVNVNVSGGGRTPECDP